MNCATHNDTAAVAFCRTCGKPLCQGCTHDVRGVIYCEACLAARMEGSASASVPPPPGYTPVQTGYQQFMDQGLGVKVQPGPASGPNPAVAGMLAGIFPIGVGAVYTGQYAKGLAHLVIVVLLIVGLGADLPWYLITMMAIGLGFFYVYQIIDAIRTAKAIQMGQPAPDPFGLGQAFGTGEKFEGAKVPTGAAVLIALGVLFLLHTAGMFEIGMGLFISLILIFLGAWLFAKHWGLLGASSGMCQCEQCRTRKVMGPAILVTLGVLFLLASAGHISFEKTWPALLLVIGVVKLMQSNSSSAGHIGGPPIAPGMGMPVAPPIVTPPPAQNPQQPPASSDSSDFTSGSGSGEVKNV